METSFNTKLGNCEKHHQPALLLDSRIQKPLCLKCLEEISGLGSIETYFQEIAKKTKENYNKNKQLYQNIFNSINELKNKIIMKLEKILQIIKDQIHIIDSHHQHFQQQIFQEDKQLSIVQLEKDNGHEQWMNKQFRKEIKMQLDIFKKKYLTPEYLNTTAKQKQKIVQYDLNWEKIECDIIQESNIRQVQNCQAISFNKENDILVVACQLEIIVFLFINGMIGQELQRLKFHAGQVQYLQFMKLSNSFVSGGYDDMIIIWEFDMQENKWFAKQILKEDVKNTTCILINKNENLLISCGLNKIIKIWAKINYSWNGQQTFNTKDEVQGLSLNDQEDKLIANGLHNSRLVFKKGSDNYWIIIQTVNLNSNRLRQCFNLFVIQSLVGDQLQVYSYDQKKKQFQMLENTLIEQQVDQFPIFHCQYIKELEMIAVKNGKQLNIVKINKAGNYQLVKSIKFQTNDFFSRLTDDGQYLVTCEKESSKIQVRKIQLLK